VIQLSAERTAIGAKESLILFPQVTYKIVLGQLRQKGDGS
jgi:hypothetical protein